MWETSFVSHSIFKSGKANRIRAAVNLSSHVEFNLDS